MPDTVPIGEAAARKVQDRLVRYSLSPEQYAEHRRRQMSAEAAAPRVIDEIRVEGLKRVNPAVIAESMETQTGKPLDTKVLDADMRRIYGRGDFEAGSLFLAADTPLGPVYLAYGIAQDGNRTVYFYLGLP
jgi:NTE family protein